VNGSSSTGGCQPESCSETTINACDCPNNSPINGSLIDGVVPSIDATQPRWARELFTVNRNGQDSIMIGFQFSSNFYLRRVEIVLFHCPVHGINITRVKIYSSFIFPTFTSASPILLATHSSPPRDNCQSLSTISIPVQPPMASSNIYFVEFPFIGGSGYISSIGYILVKLDSAILQRLIPLVLSQKVRFIIIITILNTHVLIITLCDSDQQS
jgi:hypothetical protein